MFMHKTTAHGCYTDISANTQEIQVLQSQQAELNTSLHIQQATLDRSLFGTSNALVLTTKPHSNQDKGLEDTKS